ncbi:MAG: hypothetical protein JXR58_05325 [Bacteroidales bacterium]|nr:hypothetical protein [Bacteroidales bacterium]
MIRLLIALMFLFNFLKITAQDDIDNLLNEELEKIPDYTTATFKATRIINGHSIERMQKGDLDFRIAHRFGTINSGAYNFYGLDYSSNQLGLEYGFSNKFMAGISRSTYQKTFAGFIKYSIVRQCSGSKNIPVSISYFSGMYINSLSWENNRKDFFSSRLAYAHQLLIARKFSPAFSAQISPSLIHRNLVSDKDISNDFVAFGLAVRQKLTVRTAINIEYFYIPNLEKVSKIKIFCPLSLGLDIETGGHVFQVFITNSFTINEHSFLSETTDNWFDGGIHLGFNISRVFTINSNNRKNIKE